MSEERGEEEEGEEVGILRNFLTHPAECLSNLDNASGLAWVTWPTGVSKYSAWQIQFHNAPWQGARLGYLAFFTDVIERQLKIIIFSLILIHDRGPC